MHILIICIINPLLWMIYYELINTGDLKHAPKNSNSNLRLSYVTTIDYVDTNTHTYIERETKRNRDRIRLIARSTRISLSFVGPRQCLNYSLYLLCLGLTNLDVLLDQPTIDQPTHLRNIRFTSNGTIVQCRSLYYIIT